MTNTLPLTGSCQCGAVTYEVTKEPLASMVCHCQDCQKLSASAYSTTLAVEEDTLNVSGELGCYERVADSGRKNFAYFCVGCGNRIYHQDPDAPAFKRLKAGTLDNAAIPEPKAHVFVSRKQPWVVIPEGTPTFDEGMPPEEFKKVFLRKGSSV
jgi:hypothetical protein